MIYRSFFCYSMERQPFASLVRSLSRFMQLRLKELVHTNRWLVLLLPSIVRLDLCSGYEFSEYYRKNIEGSPKPLWRAQITGKYGEVEDEDSITNTIHTHFMQFQVK